jgi:hypothetical protein
MKLFYFNISNGECVPAFTVLPQFRATITGSKIHKIEASFNVGNIIKNGMEWYLDQAKEDYESWEYKHKHLMSSLKRLALAQALKHPFKYTNFDDEHIRFPFVTVWKPIK